MGGLSIWHWLIVLLVVVLVFGTKKLKNVGSDLGGAVKGFKDGMRDGSAEAGDSTSPTAGATAKSTDKVADQTRSADAQTIDVQARHKS